MSLLGKAALAMWWNLAAPIRAEFEHWHAHEHFPERCRCRVLARHPMGQRRRGGHVRDVRAGGPRDAFLARVRLPPERADALVDAPDAGAPPDCPEPVSGPRIVGCRRRKSRLDAALPSRSGAEEELGAVCTRLVEMLPSRPGIAGAHLLRHQLPALARRPKSGSAAAPTRPLIGCWWSAGMTRWCSRRLASQSLQRSRSRCTAPN